MDIPLGLPLWGASFKILGPQIPKPQRHFPGSVTMPSSSSLQGVVVTLVEYVVAAVNWDLTQHISDTKTQMSQPTKENVIQQL